MLSFTPFITTDLTPRNDTMNTTITITRYSRVKTAMLPWVVWGMSALFVFYQMLLQTAPSVMIGDLQQAFSINTLGVSLLSTSFCYTYVLLQIPAGILIDRVQPRYCLAACLIGISIMTIVFAFAPTLGIARAGRIMQGAFSAPSGIPAMYLAAMWFPAKYFALLAGLTEMVGISGSAIGQATLAPISGYWGWRNALLGCALIGFVLALLSYLLIRNKPQEAENTVQATQPKTPILQSLHIIISCPQAWISGLFGGILFGISAAFASFWCIPFLMKIYPISLNTAAAASSMVLFGVGLGAPLIGALSDRIGRRCMPMIISTTAVLALMLIILYVPNISMVSMFILLFVMGFFSGVYVLPYAVVRDIMPSNVRGTAMGFTNLMCILIGAPLLQPLIGGIYEKQLVQTTNEVLAYKYALAAIPISLVIGLVLTFFIKETYCGNAVKK
jgi:MFS family permease